MLLSCGVGEDLRVTWTARRSNKSILKEIIPEYSLEGLMLKPKLQNFCYSCLGNPMGRGRLQSMVRLVKAMVFAVVMYGCESWTVKKTVHRRIDAFELWCWRRLMRVPWTSGRSNQSVLKEISPDYSLEGLMLKLKLQSFGHLM